MGVETEITSVGEEAQVEEEAVEEGVVTKKEGEVEEEQVETIEQVKKAHEEQIKNFTESWKEDREFLNGEIKRLRSEANNPKLSPEEEKQLEGLDEDERVNKLVEFRRKREDEANKAEIASVASEVRFYRRTDPEFSKNEKAIVKVAEDYDCKNLKQAILMWRGLNRDKIEKDKNYNDKRKKEANGKGGGAGGGKVDTVKPYNKKEDGNKSFGDVYREGLSK